MQATATMAQGGWRADK